MSTEWRKDIIKYARDTGSGEMGAVGTGASTWGTGTRYRLGRICLLHEGHQEVSI